MQIAFGRVRCKTEPTGVVADAWKIAFLMKFCIYIYDNMFCMGNQGNFFFLGECINIVAVVSKIGNRGVAGL